MEIKTLNGAAHAPAESSERGFGHRRKRTDENANIRFFLPKPGSSAAKPELGQEMVNESEVLIEALKSGQPFFTVTAWKATPQVNGGSNPIIVKEALART
jgi:hypothetical protein